MKFVLAGLALICMPAIWLLGLGIYLFTIYIGFLNGLPSFILSIIFPGISTIYWILVAWHRTGVFFHPLTIACTVWLGLAALTSIIFALAGAK